MIRLGNCIDILPMLDQRFDLIFADPPYNQGVDYGNGPTADRIPEYQYQRWCADWLALLFSQLTRSGALWLLVPEQHLGWFLFRCRFQGLHQRAVVVWYETFGCNCTRNFNLTNRYLLYFTRSKDQFTFNADDPAIRQPSDRQAKYKDKRANPHGKLLDRVWNVPRLCGTHKERISDVPTQVPEEILTRIILGCSNAEDHVLDPFTGSGTTGAVAVRHGRQFTGIEIQKKYHTIATQRIKKEKK